MTQEGQSPDGSSNFLAPRRNIPSTLSYPMGHTAQSRYKAGGGATGECEHQEVGTPWGPPWKLSTLLPFLHCSLSTECLYPLICLPSTHPKNWFKCNFSVKLLLGTKLVLILCDPMEAACQRVAEGRRTEAFPVLHHLLEFTQTHVHWVSDAIQPSHPLSSPSPPALSLPLFFMTLVIVNTLTTLYCE